MNIIKWNPWNEGTRLQNRFFGDSFFPATGLNDEFETRNWRPAVDVYDKDDRLVIKAELPGIEKKDIEIDVKEGVLTLKGERSDENEVTEHNYYRKERTYGKFHRAFTLPESVDTEKIEANFKDGVLTVDIPKAEERKPKKISVH